MVKLGSSLTAGQQVLDPPNNLRSRSSAFDAQFPPKRLSFLSPPTTGELRPQMPTIYGDRRSSVASEGHGEEGAQAQPRLRRRCACAAARLFPQQGQEREIFSCRMTESSRRLAPSWWNGVFCSDRNVEVILVFFRLRLLFEKASRTPLLLSKPVAFGLMGD